MARSYSQGWQPRAEMVRYDAKSDAFLPSFADTDAAQMDFSPQWSPAALLSLTVR